MSKHEVIPAGQLVYGGVSIREKGEMLSLTDMWRAAGSLEGKRPDDWKKDAANRAFLDHVALISNAPAEGIWRGRRGNSGGTLAHWQVGLAYAKYLSPEFHVWCNEVVRAHMEGDKPAGIPAETLEQIERSFGIMRMVAHKVTELEKALPLMVADLIEPMVQARLAESALLLRRGKTAKQIWDAAGLPTGIKGATTWFGNRLAKGGCLLEGRADRGEAAIRLFDPDHAETLLGLGLLHKSKVYASERMGQARLKLVGGV